MDDNRKVGLRFVAFILAALGLMEIGWAMESDGNGLVGALTGLAVALIVTSVLMGLSTLDD